MPCSRAFLLPFHVDISLLYTLNAPFDSPFSPTRFPNWSSDTQTHIHTHTPLDTYISDMWHRLYNSFPAPNNNLNQSVNSFAGYLSVCLLLMSWLIAFAFSESDFLFQCMCVCVYVLVCECRCVRMCEWARKKPTRASAHMFSHFYSKFDLWSVYPTINLLHCYRSVRQSNRIIL